MNIQKKESYTLASIGTSFDELTAELDDLKSNHLVVEVSENLNIDDTIISLFLELATSFKQNGMSFVVVKSGIDIDDFPEIATELNVSGVPDFKFIVNGKICHQFSGADPNLLEDVVKQLSYKASLLPPKYPESNSNIPNSTQNTSYSMEDRPY